MLDILDQIQITPLFKTLATIAVAILVSFALRRVIERLSTIGHVSPIMGGRLQVLRRWAVLIVTCLVILQATGLFGNAWALLSTILATVAIGFIAAWSILSNVTSAILILTFRPFRHGDVVELVEPTNGTNVGGKVIDINMMYTTIRERDPESGETSTLHVPNNLFFQKLIRTRGPATTPSTTPFYTTQAPKRPSDE